MTENKGAKFNIPTFLVYLPFVGVALGLILLFTEKEDKTVRFNALQSVIALGIPALVGLTPILGWFLWPLVGLWEVGVGLFLMYKTYQGEKYKLPYIGEMAEKQLSKMK